jgi:hypothetical protein
MLENVNVILNVLMKDLDAADAPDKPAESGRYQLHVWAHAGSTPGDVGQHGAYRLDKQTGEVWSISGRDETHKLEFKPRQ